MSAVLAAGGAMHGTVPPVSTYSGPVNAVCTVLARVLVPVLNRLAEQKGKHR